MIPDRLRPSLVQAMEARTGKAEAIRSVTPVGGGCINPSARVETEGGEAFFLKWNSAAPQGMFQAEADGLEGLREAGALRVPEVVGWGGDCTRESPGWLLLEFIPSGPRTPDYGERLGEGLARMHAHGTPGTPLFGWRRDNYIGSLLQRNAEGEDWASFWRDRRIGPQLSMAREAGYFQGGQGVSLDRVQDRMEEILGSVETPDHPELLHGDLWSGNYYPGPQGEPILIDPAAYRGAGEVDLAMMELFGSFPRGFGETYQEVRGLGAEYDAFLRDLYQLYYLLVHVNLFGGGYLGGCLAAARGVLQNV